MLSVPVMRLLSTGAPTSLILWLDQAACGRHMGEDLELLRDIFGGTPVNLWKESLAWLTRNVVKTNIAVAAAAIATPVHASPIS